MPRARHYQAGAEAALVKLALSEALTHALDLGGLGLLAVPVAHDLIRRDNSPENPGTRRIMRGLEMGGLGALAVPSLVKLLTHGRG